MITLSDDQISMLICNMLKANDADVRSLALQDDPTRIGFADRHGVKFTQATITAIWTAARALDYFCEVCGDRKSIALWDSDSSGCDLCSACYELAGWENEHTDHGHESAPVADCPICQDISR